MNNEGEYSMNKKILTILGVSVISLTLSTDIIFANNSSIEEAPQSKYLSTHQANAQQIINYAKQQLGKPYVWNTAGPNTFDCSGFIYYVFSHNGYNISRTNVEHYWGNSNIKKVSTPSPGDLIFFKGTYGESNHPSHIGIMINDTQFIHAANEKDGVIITNINNPYWRSHILGYGNIIPSSANKKPVYRIVTGGFTGMKRAKYEVGFLKGQFGWDATIKPNKNDNKYSIVTGGFVGMERAKYEVGFLKGQFGWDATIKPNGDRPNEYKLVIDGFIGEDEVATAKQRLDGWTGWYTETCPDDSNEYKLVIDGFVGEDEVVTAKQRLDGWTGWYTEYEPTGEYK